MHSTAELKKCACHEIIQSPPPPTHTSNFLTRTPVRPHRGNLLSLYKTETLWIKRPNFKNRQPHHQFPFAFSHDRKCTTDINLNFDTNFDTERATQLNAPRRQTPNSQWLRHAFLRCLSHFWWKTWDVCGRIHLSTSWGSKHQADTNFSERIVLKRHLNDCFCLASCAWEVFYKYVYCVIISNDESAPGSASPEYLQ